MRDNFSNFHPLVSLIYFFVVMAFCMVFMHPISLTISLVCAIFYCFTSVQGKKTWRTILYIIPMIIIMALLNPLLNHRGVTTLIILPWGNPLTLESTLFGVATAFMIVAIFFWFICFNYVMSSDKIIFIFGKLSPTLGLIISMSLQLIPRFKERLNQISNARNALGLPNSYFKSLSILVTWALENSIETAASMKSRGYGLGNRTFFSIYTFKAKDSYLLIFICICVVAILFGLYNNVFAFNYFPYIRYYTPNLFGAIIFFIYLLLHLIPIMVSRIT